MPASSSRFIIDPALVADDAAVTEFFYKQYRLDRRSKAQARVARALAALQRHDPGATALSLSRDILPKLEMLEALSPGLGWKVFRRYPEQFGDPDAGELWRILGAYLFQLGLTPEQVIRILIKHHALFKVSVVQPSGALRLTRWLTQDLGLTNRQVAKLICRCPPVLALDVETVLKPRVAPLQELGLSDERIGRGIVRQPEVLAMDSSVLRSRTEYLMSPPSQGGPGLSQQDVAALFVREPSAVLAALPRIRQTVAWLRDELRLEPALVCKLVGKGGVVKYPLSTLEERRAYWQQELGLALPELHRLLDSWPRAFLYPMREPKYQLKLRFLAEELRQPLAPTLLAFPPYLTYSLPKRIVLRYAAARDLANTRLPLQKLAFSEDRFLAWLKVPPERYAVWRTEWLGSAEAEHWAAEAAAAAAASSPSCMELDDEGE